MTIEAHPQKLPLRQGTGAAGARSGCGERSAFATKAASPISGSRHGSATGHRLTKDRAASVARGEVAREAAVQGLAVQVQAVDLDGGPASSQSCDRRVESVDGRAVPDLGVSEVEDDGGVAVEVERVRKRRGRCEEELAVEKDSADNRTPAPTP
jgi:hypothetical protein